MIYEVLRPATGLEVGETYSAEEIATKGDVNNMVRKGIIRPVGFLQIGAPMGDNEAAQTIAELQKKLEAMEKERDEAREEIKEKDLKIKSLEVGHREGYKQLTEAQARVTALEAELTAERAKKTAAA